MTEPPVSVVVATHYRPVLLRRAIASVLAQAYAGALEVVVVFDGETPYRPDVAVPAGATLTVTANRRTRGLAGARNTGIARARHDLVAFLDDDDAWRPDKLRRQVALLATDPALLLVAAAIVVTVPGDRGRTVERRLPTAPITHAQLLRDSLAGLHPSGFLVRRPELLARVGWVDEDVPGSYGEDYDLVLRVARVQPIRAVDAPLVEVRWTGQSHFFGRWGAYADGLAYLLDRHPGFRADRVAYGRLAGQIAFCRAAAGERRQAAGWALRSLRATPTQARSWLALAVAGRLLSAAWVVRTLQRRGRGI